MRFQINGVQFEIQEVECIGLFDQLVTNERGEPFYTTRRLQVVVDQTITGVQANANRFQAIRNQVAAGVTSVGFNDVNGTPLPPLTIYAGQTISGIRVMNPPSWTPRTPVEMATHMSILLTFEADYEITGGSQIMAYEDTFTFEDEGDQRIVPLETDTGPVEFFTVCQQPVRYLTQSGFIVGRDAYPLRNAVLSYPTVRRTLTRKSPGKLGNRYMGYLVAWQYTYVVPSVDEWYPVLR